MTRNCRLGLIRSIDSVPRWAHSHSMPPAKRTRDIKPSNGPGTKVSFGPLRPFRSGDTYGSPWCNLGMLRIRMGEEDETLFSLRARWLIPVLRWDDGAPLRHHRDIVTLLATGKKTERLRARSRGDCVPYLGLNKNARSSTVYPLSHMHELVICDASPIGSHGAKQRLARCGVHPPARAVTQSDKAVHVVLIQYSCLVCADPLTRIDLSNLNSSNHPRSHHFSIGCHSTPFVEEANIMSVDVWPPVPPSHLESAVQRSLVINSQAQPSWRSVLTAL
jgi:hypothetical protein